VDLAEGCDLGYNARTEAHGRLGILPAEIVWCCRHNSNLDYQGTYLYLAKSCREEYFQVDRSAKAGGGTSYQETKVDSQMFETDRGPEVSP
jgi:hypothetical protein